MRIADANSAFLPATGHRDPQRPIGEAGFTLGPDGQRQERLFGPLLTRVAVTPTAQPSRSTPRLRTGVIVSFVVATARGQVLHQPTHRCGCVGRDRRPASSRRFAPGNLCLHQQHPGTPRLVGNHQVAFAAQRHVSRQMLNQPSQGRHAQSRGAPSHRAGKAMGLSPTQHPRRESAAPGRPARTGRASPTGPVGERSAARPLSGTADPPHVNTQGCSSRVADASSQPGVVEQRNSGRCMTLAHGMPRALRRPDVATARSPDPLRPCSAQAT
jgi:hypothetical protein